MSDSLCTPGSPRELRGADRRPQSRRALGDTAHRDARVRALHVISGDLWAGAEVQAYTLLLALRRAGVEVMAALMNDGELADRLRCAGVALRIFPEREQGPVRILLGLRRLIAEWRPDVVHTHRQKENVLGSLANYLSRRAACVRTVHGSAEHAAHGLARRVAQSADRWCGRHLQGAVIAVSGELATELGRRYGSDHVRIIRNGVDVDAIRAQVKPVDFREQEPQAVHVGIVGRLVPVKRVDLFIEIAAHLCADMPEVPWRFQVIGDGPLAASLSEAVRYRGLDRAIRFHGHRADSVACIAALDALVLCSDHEGLPMTLLEARALGTPVVAHAVGGMREVLEQSPSDRLVFEHQPRAYAAALRELIALPRSTQVAASLPSSDRNARETLVLYRELTRPFTADADGKQETSE